MTEIRFRASAEVGNLERFTGHRVNLLKEQADQTQRLKASVDDEKNAHDFGSA